MAGRADFEVQLVLGRPRLEGVAARAARIDLLILRVDPFFHDSLLYTATSAVAGGNKNYTTYLGQVAGLVDSDAKSARIGPNAVRQRAPRLVDRHRQPDVVTPAGALAKGRRAGGCGRRPGQRDLTEDRLRTVDRDGVDEGVVHLDGDRPRILLRSRVARRQPQLRTRRRRLQAQCRFRPGAPSPRGRLRIRTLDGIKAFRLPGDRAHGARVQRLRRQ